MINYGKTPPQAKEIEEAILGAILLERDAYDEVSEMITADCFYVNAHQSIYNAMKSLSAKHQPIDLHTVENELKIAGELDKVGGSYALIKLTNSVVSSANIKSHCRIVLQKFIQRRIITIASDLITEAYQDIGDSFSLLDQAEEKLSQLSADHLHGDMVEISSVLVSTIKQIETWRQQDSTITGVPSGFGEMDKATRGWQGGDLVIIAARPSIGKTAFALNLIDNAATNSLRPTAVAVWSLEMKAMHLVLRMLAKRSKIMLYKIQTGKLNDDDMKVLYKDGIQTLAKLKIFFDDKAGLNLMKLRAKARRLKKKHDIGLLVIDYLQLMDGDGNNREQEISKNSRGLKNLAQELNIPIIALSQLNRDIEKRTGANREPQLSDLRESGAIEQDADLVIFLWGPTEGEIMEDKSLEFRRYAKIAKQRNGFLGKYEFDFTDSIQLFEVANQMKPYGFRAIEVPLGEQLHF